MMLTVTLVLKINVVFLMFLLTPCALVGKGTVAYVLHLRKQA